MFNVFFCLYTGRRRTLRRPQSYCSPWGSNSDHDSATILHTIIKINSTSYNPILIIFNAFSVLLCVHRATSHAPTAAELLLTLGEQFRSRFCHNFTYHY